MWRDPSVTAAQAAFVLEPRSVSHAVVLLSVRFAVVRLSFRFAVVLFSVIALLWCSDFVCSLCCSDFVFSLYDDVSYWRLGGRACQQVLRAKHLLTMSV